LPEGTSILRSERLERRQAILDLRIAMLDKQLACQRMVRDNNTLRIELSKLLKENRDILTSEDIEALKAINRRSGGWPISCAVHTVIFAISSTLYMMALRQPWKKSNQLTIRWMISWTYGLSS